MPGPKSREDYLIAYHKDLHTALLSAYVALNRNFMFVYGAAIIIVAVDLGLVTEVSGSGIKLQAGDGLLYFLAVLVALIYALINYQILRISDLFSEVVNNAGALVHINGQARVITINDVLLFTTGITGLILSLAKWQANRLARMNPLQGLAAFFHMRLPQLPMALYHFLKALSTWGTNILVRGAILLSLFFFPMLVFECFLFAKLNVSWQVGAGVTLPQPDVALLLFLALLLVSLFTAVSGLKLFLSFFVELIEDLLQQLRDEVDDVAAVAKAQMTRKALDLARLLLRNVVP